MGQGQYDGNDVIIKGLDTGGNEHAIEMIDDAGVKRAATDGLVEFKPSQQVAISPLPITVTAYKSVYLENASSNDMTVDGSSVVKNFDWTPGTDETWYLESLIILIQNTGNNGIANFGAESVLTNGLQFFVKSDGTEYELFNLKDNGDIVLAFCSPVAIQGNGGFIELDGYWGMTSYRNSIEVKDSASDYIRVKVRDDLTDLDFLRVLANIWKVVT